MPNRRTYEPDRDLLSPNKNISPITSELDGNNRLTIGGCLLSDLAKSYGTPLYVIDEETVRTACLAYRNALKKYYPGKSLPIYASKANSSLVMSSIISSEGFGLDAVSEGELLTALRGGVPRENIVLHGNNKSDAELIFAYENDITIVVDNYHDIERLSELIQIDKPKVKLMIRFTPGIECHTHEYIKTGHLDSKFGFDLDNLEFVLHKLKEYPWAKVNGLHAHIGSQIFELDPHKDLASVMADVLKSAKEVGHDIQDLNIGGGLGIRYISSDDPPSISEWIKAVSQSIENACRERALELPRLMCEPGRSLVATAGITIYSIGSKKEIPGLRNYLSVDGGMSDNPRPITYKSLYTACLADRPIEKPTEIFTIAGKHCESGDVLLKDFSLPKVNSGDYLVVFSTGAYNSSMSSNYNRIPRPAAVIVSNGKSELIQKRESTEDLLRFDLLPDRFMA